MQIVCIGAGPAGLTAAYLLTKAGKQVTVLEKDPEYVGGISRTVKRDGYCFDIGGHRLFSKSDEVEALWQEILHDDFIQRPRKSRIYYRGKFYPYPLKLKETLFNLGIIPSGLCVLSYLWVRAFPIKNPRNFEQWVINHFGRRLFLTFFKTYTEKVWGIPCDQISADWAAQRIKGLSLYSAIKNAILPQKQKPGGPVIKTLIDSFKYPRKGPGMMWEKAARLTGEQGGKVLLGAEVTGLEYIAASKQWNVTYKLADGGTQVIAADHVISSAPLREVALEIPGMPESAKDAARKLHYRDFLIVALVVKDRDVFDDNWIYIHDPSVKVGRIQNFKSWSPEMVPEEGRNCYGLEYFCFEGDGVWASADEDLVKLASKELVALGLASADDIIRGYVVRQPKAYPVYDDEYATHVATIRTALELNFPGLHVVGRNGMHKYNNQDHAMMTAMLAAKNIIAGETLYDVWNVNQDAQYHETVSAEETSSVSGLRAVPTKVKP